MLNRFFKLDESGTNVKTEVLAGVSQGGRTGLATIVTGFLMLGALFLNPLFP